MGYFVTVIASISQRLPWRPPLACGGAGVAPKAPVPQAREAILRKPRDCFGKKRLAMTVILSLNEYSSNAVSIYSRERVVRVRIKPHFSILVLYHFYLF
jgi:hypothetical protein